MDTNQVRELTDRIDAVLGGYEHQDEVEEMRAKMTLSCLAHRLEMVLGDLNLQPHTTVISPTPAIQFGSIREFDRFVCQMEDLRDEHLRKGSQ